MIGVRWNEFLGDLFMGMSADFLIDLVCITVIMVPNVGKVSNQNYHPSLHFKEWKSNLKKIPVLKLFQLRPKETNTR